MNKRRLPNQPIAVREHVEQKIMSGVSLTARLEQAKAKLITEGDFDKAEKIEKILEKRRMKQRMRENSLEQF